MCSERSSNAACRVPARARCRSGARGIISVLSMVYLALFATLAVGLYAAFTLATQTSYNDRDSRRALAAAESGMEFARFHLWELNIAYAPDAEALFNRVEDGLETRLNGTANLSGGNIARVGNVIYIPASGTDYIPLNNTGDGFRLEITHDGTELNVRSFGCAASMATSSDDERGIGLRYGVFQRPSSIFNFGVASRGAVSMDSNAAVIGSPDPAHGSILSASMAGTPVSVLGNSLVSGDVSIVNPTGKVTYSSGSSIGGSTSAKIKSQHIHSGVAEPQFPIIDTDIYKKYATNIVSTPGAKFDTTNVKNLYIKANTNPIFSGSIKVEGVVYIETPNYVTFDSNVEVTGAIVTQNNPTGTTSSNRIDILSNVKLRGVEYLPATSDFPADLRALKGSMILAEGFKLYFDSNFGAEGGSIVGSDIHFDSNATGTINGSVIGLSDTPMQMNSNTMLTIANQGDGFAPPGMYFGSRYVPLPGSYEEITP